MAYPNEITLEEYPEHWDLITAHIETASIFNGYFDEEDETFKVAPVYLIDERMGRKMPKKLYRILAGDPTQMGRLEGLGYAARTPS
jgi:hypothetical protein